jgi:RHS repeat-associated protein
MKALLKIVIINIACISMMVEGFAQTRNQVTTWTAMSPQTDPNSLMSKPSHDVRQATEFFDQMGRPEQVVIKEGSLATGAGLTDLVTFSTYDSYGLESTKYLPYSSTENNGLFKNNVQANQSQFYASSASPYINQGETNFYNQVDFELSPSNRVLKTYAPGKNWVGAGVGIQTAEWVNTSTDDVKIWEVSNSNPTGSLFATYSSIGVYTSGALFKNVVNSEDGKQTITFVDKIGNTILIKKQTSAPADNGSGSGYSGWICTYYLYDDLNNLRCIVQPNGVQQLASNGWNLSDVTILGEQCFRYEYDDLGQMKVKKLPGTVECFIVHDALGRTVMTQDGNQRPTGSWTVTLYDKYNRQIYTGKITSPLPYDQHLSNASTSTTYPGYLDEIYTQTHYDDYSSISVVSGTYNNTWNNQFSPTDNAQFPYPQMPSQNSSYSILGKEAWSKVRILGTNNFLYQSNIYDDKGRIIQVQKSNVTNLSSPTDYITTQYNWAGIVLTTVQNHQNYSGGYQSSTIVTKQDYDDLGRLVRTQKKVSNSNINGGAFSNYTTASEYLYDALGYQKTKILGRQKNSISTYTSNALERQEYEYNIRGWILGMNRQYVADLSTASNVINSGETFTTPPTYTAGSYFGYDLGYEKDGVVGTYNHLTNGNVSGTIWKSVHDGQIRKQDYQYDGNNRLIYSDFKQYTNGSFNKTAGVDFSTTTGYDDNGNIQYKDQVGLRASNSLDFIDRLTYRYQTGSNKLLEVNDGGANTSGEMLGDFQNSNNSGNDYAYDDNGNMTIDLNKQITSISYNHLNLPETIEINAHGTIQFVYDGLGNTLSKTITNKTVSPWAVKTLLYINGFAYDDGLLQYMPFEEGRIRIGGSEFVYDYFLKDHLSNVRLVLTDQYSSSSNPVLEANSYYPYGQVMAGISLSSATVNVNNFKYNGKELQSEEFSGGIGLNWYSYGMRDYDPQIGRFLRLDPLSQRFVSLTPYQYASNDPVKNIDLDGLEAMEAVWRSAGFIDYGGGNVKWDKGSDLYKYYSSGQAYVDAFHIAVGLAGVMELGAALIVEEAAYGALAASASEAGASVAEISSMGAEGARGAALARRAAAEEASVKAAAETEAMISDNVTKFQNSAADIISQTSKNIEDLANQTLELYRFDFRTPLEIEQAGGFKPWGTDMDLLKHADGTNIMNKTSGYVSTSSKESAVLDMFDGGDPGYMYKIKYPFGDAVDVNKKLGLSSPHQYEFEFAIPNTIPFSHIIDSWLINVRYF